MTESLATFLNVEGADPITIQHAARYVVANLSDYETESNIREEIAVAAGGDQPVNDAMHRLTSDAELLLETDLALLAAYWEDPETQPLIRQAIAAGHERLPVVIPELIALMTLYGMYLIATGGRKSESKKIEYKSDGSWTESTDTKFHDPAAAFKALGELFARFLRGG